MPRCIDTSVEARPRRSERYDGRVMFSGDGKVADVTVVPLATTVKRVVPPVVRTLSTLPLIT
jgi:hypothetical protein